MLFTTLFSPSLGSIAAMSHRKEHSCRAYEGVRDADNSTVLGVGGLRGGVQC